MTPRSLHRRALLLFVPLIAAGVAGCGAADAASGMTQKATVAAPAPTTSSGSPSPTARPSVAASRGPSAAARMVCSDETRGNVQHLLGLSTPPRSSATWQHETYTCSYRLAEGPLLLAVHETGSAAAARRAFAEMRKQQPTATAITGLAALGLPAFESADGRVVFLKDDATLSVDASHLPAEVGATRETRAGLAYALATDVLGCWAGD